MISPSSTTAWGFELRIQKAMDTYSAFVVCRGPDMVHLIYCAPLERKLKLMEVI